METEIQVTISSPQKIYLRFVELLQAFKDPSSFPELDDIDPGLLNQIASLYFVGKPLLVSGLNLSNKKESSVTFNRRLSKLLKKDLIRHGSEIDGRKKYLELTQKILRLLLQSGRMCKGLHSLSPQ